MRTWWRGLLLGGVALSAISLAGCGEKPKPRVGGDPGRGAALIDPSLSIATVPSGPAAKVASPKGTILVRPEASDAQLDQLLANPAINDYKVADQDSALMPGQTVLSFHDGKVVSTNGKVSASLRADLSGKNPLPVLETAIKTRAATPGADFEFSIERGRVDLVNTAKEGKVTVRVQGPSSTADLVLASPGTRVVVELYGRWMPGSRFTELPAGAAPTPANSPLMRWLVLVLKGEVEINHPRSSFRLVAPPGNSLIQGQSGGDRIVVPEHLEAIPDWVNENPKDPEVAKFKPALDKLAGLLAKESDFEKVFETFGHGKEPAERLVAIYGLAALDDLPRMFHLIRSTRTPEVVDEGIIALRHFLGRRPGMDQVFFKFLTGHSVGPAKAFTNKQAEAFIDLLYGFNDEQKAQPTTYSYLLRQLSSPRPGIRGLAIWHLNRLVPEGQKIGYDPTDEEPAREAAIRKWKDKLTELKKLPEPPPASKAPAPKPKP